MAINVFPFLITTLTISLMPGMAMFYCIHTSLQQGRSAGIAAAVGVELGTLAYVLITALGLSTLITASPLIYGALKVMGSGYLFYLAYTGLPKGKQITPAHAQRKTLTKRSKLWGGFLLNAMNPKLLIFFLTLLPQFVPLEEHRAGTFLLLGLIFNLSGLMVNAAIAYFSPQISKLFSTETYVLTVLKYIPSIVFSGTAIYGVSDLIKHL